MVAGESLVAADRLISFVERIERLLEDRSALNADLREVYAEAKSAGFDTRTLKRVVKERAIEPMTRAEQLSMFEIYWNAVGTGARAAEAA